MKKRLLALTLMLCMALLLLPMGVRAAETSGTCGDSLTWAYDDETKTLNIEGTGDMWDFEAYSQPWISLMPEIQKITVPKGVTRIGTYAFSMGENPIAITFEGDAPVFAETALENTSSEIYYYAYNETWTLDIMQDYGGNTSWQEYGREPDPVVTYAFDEATGTLTVSGNAEIEHSNSPWTGAPWEPYMDRIRVLVIEEGVMGRTWSMEGCETLTSVTLPGTLTEISNGTFAGCTALSQVTLVEGIEVISANAFSGCTALTEIEIPASVTKIAGNSFVDCVNLETIWIDPASEAFCNDEWGVVYSKDMTTLVCTPGGLEGKYTIPETVTQMYGMAFWGCTGLTEVEIAEGLKELPEFAFANCTALERIVIPGSVERIYWYVFQNCTSLREIVFTGDAPQLFLSAPLEGLTATVYYPAGNVTWTEEVMDRMERMEDAATPGVITKITWVLYDTLTSTEILRLAGAHRYETAFLAADRMKINLGIEKFDAVVVASGTNFADALSGSYLAAVKNAPILLASGVDRVDELVKDYILENLNPGGIVYILGGTGAVPAAFEDGLDDFDVNRLAGGNRFETNLMILEEAGVGDKPILVCTGLSFADSLSASASKLPILLVWNNLTDGQKTLLDGLKGKKLYIIGGESAVSKGMEKQLTAYGEVERVAGGNRFETSVAIAEKFFDAPKSAVLAYAWNFPDGLCGGPLAASMDAPLILTMGNYEAQATGYVRGNAIKNGIILGGETLIPEKSVNQIFNIRQFENELPIG